MNLLGGIIETINKNTDNLIDASKEVGLEVNIEKTTYMLVPRHQNAGQNQDIQIANRMLEHVTQLKYLGTTATIQILIHEEIKRRLNSGNACYQSVQNRLSSCLLLKNVKIRICKTIILPVVLYGCETWSLTLREKQGAEENIGPMRDEVSGG
jgi:hypothetical protein